MASSLPTTCVDLGAGAGKLKAGSLFEPSAGSREARVLRDAASDCMMRTSSSTWGSSRIGALVVVGGWRKRRELDDGARTIRRPLASSMRNFEWG
jgi:hypothetical protein